MLLEDVLTYEGFEVKTCATGMEALTELRQVPYDLVILDYKLPVLDGMEVIRHLEAENIDVPAVLISGLVEEFSEATEDSQLIKAVIGKPFNVQEIGSVIKGVVSPP
ncbi:putative transcriptional regulatory protein TcrX [Lentibacillus sp. JNUCC-1]|nr:putative transcriptional regulatory protein TcrX [Lentibacillus sp. JNUCC-1]